MSEPIQILYGPPSAHEEVIVDSTSQVLYGPPPKMPVTVVEDKKKPTAQELLQELRDLREVAIAKVNTRRKM